MSLVVWTVAACRDTVSQVVFVYVLVFLIPAAGLTHCVAGSAEVLMAVFAGETSFGAYLGRLLLPSTLGNTVGGVFLVALLNFAQVAGSRRRTSLSRYTDGGEDGPRAPICGQRARERCRIRRRPASRGAVARLFV